MNVFEFVQLKQLQLTVSPNGHLSDSENHDILYFACPLTKPSGKYDRQVYFRDVAVNITS